MKETRTLTIKQKRFTRADLASIADLISKLSQSASTPGDGSTLCFTVRTADNIEYESDDTLHLQEGAELDLKPVSAVAFEFRGWVPRRGIEFNLTDGGSYSDRIIVFGEDKIWVHSAFSQLTERLGSVADSESWFTRHPRLLYHLCALGSGTIVMVVLGHIVRFIVWHSPDLLAFFQNEKRPEGLGWDIFFAAADVPFLWLLGYWFLGLGYAIGIRNWILAAWPTIELDVGPAHIRRPMQRRARLGVFFIGIVLPILGSLIYDIGKLTFQNPEPPKAVASPATH